MKVIDTSKESLDIFAAGQFDLRKWEHYIDKAVPGAKELCLDGDSNSRTMRLQPYYFKRTKSWQELIPSTLGPFS